MAELKNRTVGVNAAEIEIIRAIAASGEDKPVLMLNCNRYTAEAGFPDGELYNAEEDSDRGVHQPEYGACFRPQGASQ